jgi:hypothetical protein
MTTLEDLKPGDIVQFIDPNTQRFGVGTFDRIIKRRTGDKRTDIILKTAIGGKTTIQEGWIKWEMMAHQMGATS